MPKYDAFISYRRSDSATAAKWLRRAIQSHRLPVSMRPGRTKKLSVFLDTAYERGAVDFYTKTIRPALMASEHLIVMASPDAAQNREDDWVLREIEDFSNGPNSANIMVARVAGKLNDPLPHGLMELYPNIQILDFRGVGTFSSYFPAQAARHKDELLKIISPLHNIAVEQMPELRREQARQRHFRIGVSLGAASIITIFSIALSVISMRSQIVGQQAIEESLTTSEQVVRQISTQLNNDRLFTRDANSTLIASCRVAERLGRQSERDLDRSIKLICDLEEVLGVAVDSQREDLNTQASLTDICISAAKLAKAIGSAQSITGCGRLAEDDQTTNTRIEGPHPRLVEIYETQLQRLEVAGLEILLTSDNEFAQTLMENANLAWASLKYRHRFIDLDMFEAFQKETELLRRVIDMFKLRALKEKDEQDNAFATGALTWSIELSNTYDAFAKKIDSSDRDKKLEHLQAYTGVLQEIAELERAFDLNDGTLASLAIFHASVHENISQLLSDDDEISKALEHLERAREKLHETIERYPTHSDHLLWGYWVIDYDWQIWRLRQKLGERDGIFKSGFEIYRILMKLVQILPNDFELLQEVIDLSDDMAEALHYILDHRRSEISDLQKEGDFFSALEQIDVVLAQRKELYALSNDNRRWASYFMLMGQSNRAELLEGLGKNEEAETLRLTTFAEMLKMRDDSDLSLTALQKKDFQLSIDAIINAHHTYLDNLADQADELSENQQFEDALKVTSRLLKADKAWDSITGRTEYDLVYQAYILRRLADLLDKTGRHKEARKKYLGALRLLVPLSKQNTLNQEQREFASEIWQALANWASKQNVDIAAISESKPK